MEKITKTQMFETIKELCADNADVVAFCDAQIASLASKAEKAKARAAEKKAEGDELRAAVKAVLTNELQTGEQILAQIDGEDLSKAKIIARCTALVKAGEAVKDNIKTDNGTRVGYKLAD